MVEGGSCPRLQVRSPVAIVGVGAGMGRKDA